MNLVPFNLIIQVISLHFREMDSFVSLNLINIHASHVYDNKEEFFPFK